MSVKRRIAVVTGSRADYGPLYWIMRRIKDDPQLELQLIVTGMHLSPEFGYTYTNILADGFSVDAKVEMLLSSDTPAGVAKSMGLGCIGMADALRNLAPDMLVVLGDRFESFAAAQAAMISRLPIAHVHGGESTQGSFDEAIRHSITKMAHLHFVAAESFRSRVIQLGEQPNRVFTVGAPGLDHIRNAKLMSSAEVHREFALVTSRPLLLVTYHPVTLSDQSPAQLFRELLAALDRFPAAQVVFTYPNADTAGREIIAEIQAYGEKWPDRVRTAVSLGQVRYLSLMKYADLMVGNSSSGLIEAPTFRTPAVNVGDRQKGRLRAATVLDCAEERSAIERTIKKGLSKGFNELTKGAANPYGDGRSAARIVRELKRTKLEGIVMKRFYDLEPSELRPS